MRVAYRLRISLALRPSSRVFLNVIAAAFMFVAVQPISVRAGLTHDPALHWRTLKGKHFLVHYYDGQAALARQALAIAEQVHTRLVPRIQWQPRSRTEIILSDRYDGPNGYATVVPDKRMGIYLNAPDDIEGLEDFDAWLETVITHEYLHILHIDKAAGAPLGFRGAFGRIPIPLFNTFPNANQPNWLIEGLATYAETDTARGIGRGQSAYFNMLMRVEVAGGVKPLRQINQPIATWPHGFAPYLYGVEFYNFVAARYGADQIARLVQNYSNDVIPFRINTNSRATFGRDLPAMWREFKDYLKEKHGAQTATIAREGIVAGEQLTHDGYFGGAVRAVGDGDVIYLRSDGRSEPRLVRWREGAKPEAFAYVRNGARFDVHPEAGVLLAQTERQHNANVYYDLYRVSWRGAKTRLTRAARYRFAAWSPDARRIVAAHSENARHALHLLDADGRRLEVLNELEADAVLSELDWSPDGASIVAAVWRPQRGWNIERFDLATRQWERLTDDAAIDGQPRFSVDGGAVLFTSERDGVFNLYRLTLADRQLTMLTRVLGGAFYPSEDEAAYYFSGYGPKGFDVFRLPKREALAAPRVLPVASSKAPASTVAAPLASAALPQNLDDQPYTPWSSLAPRWWFPHLILEIDRTEVGAITAGADSLLRHVYALDVAYDATQANFVGSVDYVYDRWFPLFKLHADRASEFARNGAGDVLRIWREDTFQLEGVLPFVFQRRTLSLHASALQVKASDSAVAAGVIARPAAVDNILGAALAYDSARRYPLSISASHGRRISLVAEGSDVIDGSDFSGHAYIVDWREFVPLAGEHVLALRVAEGWGTDAPRPFVLGGNASANINAGLAAIVSPRTADVLFNRRDYPLRGYPRGLPQLQGRRMQLGSAEWRFPLKRVERGWMAPVPLALAQVHAALFADAGAVWQDGRTPDRFYRGIGAELRADLFAFYDLPAQLRLGYAEGRNEGGDRQVYLRLGAAF